MPRILRLNEGGRDLVRVELSNARGLFATLDADDYERFVAAGHSTNWFLNGVGSSRYVRFNSPDVLGGIGTVARVITGTPHRHVVRYRNGDRLDLRRANLLLTQGFAPGQTPARDEFYDPSRACDVSALDAAA
jgi:hypothetical protein